MEQYEIQSESIDARVVEGAAEAVWSEESYSVDPVAELALMEDVLFQFPSPEPWQDWASDPIVMAVESKRLALAGELMSRGELVLCGECYMDEFMVKYRQGEFDHEGRRPDIDRLVQVTYFDFDTSAWDRNRLYIYREPFSGEKVTPVNPAA
jgi:hypothetical protein